MSPPPAKRLKEPAPGRIQLLAGPRQVGKTTLLLELAAELGEAAIYAAADSPEAAFLEGGTQLIWVIDPARETVVVYDQSATPRVLRAGDSLDCHDLLSGLSLDVGSLFRDYRVSWPAGRGGSEPGGPRAGHARDVRFRP